MRRPPSPVARLRRCRAVRPRLAVRGPEATPDAVSPGGMKPKACVQSAGDGAPGRCPPQRDNRRRHPPTETGAEQARHGSGIPRLGCHHQGRCPVGRGPGLDDPPVGGARSPSLKRPGGRATAAGGQAPSLQTGRWVHPGGARTPLSAAGAACGDLVSQLGRPRDSVRGSVSRCRQHKSWNSALAPVGTKRAGPRQRPASISPSCRH